MSDVRWHLEVDGRPRCLTSGDDPSADIAMFDAVEALPSPRAVYWKCGFDSLGDALKVARVVVEFYPSVCVVSGSCNAPG